MRKRYWSRRNKPASHYLSDYNNPRIIDARYIQPSPFNFIPCPEQPVVVEPVEEVVVRTDCQIKVSGLECVMETGSVEVISWNEPTEALKNKKTSMHPREVAYAPDLGTSSRYGGWVGPYGMVNRGCLGSSRIERKKKTYEYY